jgi:hypothetical protein
LAQQEPETARVRIFVEDHTGNKRREARIRSDAPVFQLIPALVAALRLPVFDPSGRPVTYHLASGGCQLQEEDALESGEVVDGAVLSIIPEQTAGGAPDDVEPNDQNNDLARRLKELEAEWVNL